MCVQPVLPRQKPGKVRGEGVIGSTCSPRPISVPTPWWPDNMVRGYVGAWAMECSHSRHSHSLVQGRWSQFTEPVPIRGLALHIFAKGCLIAKRAVRRDKHLKAISSICERVSGMLPLRDSSTCKLHLRKICTKPQPGSAICIAKLGLQPMEY